MASEKTGAMEPGQAHVAQGKLPRERGDRSLAVARRALTFCMAAGAEVAGARRPNTVLTDEVTVMNEVIVRRRSLFGEVDVTAGAIAQRPLLAVLVAPEARRHLWQDGLRMHLRHLGVAAHAVAVYGAHVAWVLEAELGAGELGRLPHVRFAVAVHARPVVVRVFVTVPADGLAGEVERAGLSRVGDVRVALDAVDPLQHVRAVLERVRRGLRAQTEHARAGGKRDRQDDRPGGADLHRKPGRCPGAVVGGLASA
jgi:hypothetical protein